MQPRPLPRLVRPAGEGAGLHPLAVILVLLPFVLLAVAGFYSLNAVTAAWTPRRILLSVFHPAIVLGIGGTARILPYLIAGLRGKLDERRAGRAAYWTTRIGVFIIIATPIMAFVFFLFAGLGVPPVIPLGPDGLIVWLAAGSAAASLVSGRFFERIVEGLADIHRNQLAEGKPETE